MGRSSMYALAFSLSLLAACAADPREGPSQERAAVPASVDTTAPSDIDQPAAVDVEKLSFDRSTVPAGIRYVGRILDGAHWRDANGENWLVIAGREIPAQEGVQQELGAWAYVLADTGARLLWDIHDNAENWCDKGEGVVSDIHVVDLDGDGIAENAFVYNVQGTCDVSPKTYKLMLHSGGTKYAIRGTSRVNPGDQWVGGEMKVDAAFDRAPSSFRPWAIRLWKESVHAP